jgi:hypothetical protein
MLYDINGSEEKLRHFRLSRSNTAAATIVSEERKLKVTRYYHA